MQEVPPGPPDQLTRLERYRQEHPDVAIQPPGAQSAVWRAFRNGELIAYGFTLMVFMDRLETLPEPLGVVQDFGLQHLARRPLAGRPVKCSRFICLTAGTRTVERDLGRMRQVGLVTRG